MPGLTGKCATLEALRMLIASGSAAADGEAGLLAALDALTTAMMDDNDDDEASCRSSCSWRPSSRTAPQVSVCAASR